MLNQAKREEQQQKLLEMAEAKERQEVAEERASRLRVKGRDGDEVSMRTGVLETFAGEFVQTHIGAYVESSRSAVASKALARGARRDAHVAARRVEKAA